MIITVFAGSYIIGFIVKKSAVCDNNHIQFCTTQDICKSAKLYWWDNYCHITNEPAPQLSEYPDYNTALSFSSTTIVADTTTTAQFNPITKKLTLSGKFQRMYFLISASVDYGKPLTVYDDIFLNLIPGFPFANGAHLVPTDSLPTPPSSKSTLLYSANYLQLKPLKSDTKTAFDASALFKDGKSLTLMTTLSSARNGGEFSFVIYYECEASSTCSIIAN